MDPVGAQGANLAVEAVAAATEAQEGGKAGGEFADLMGAESPEAIDGVDGVDGGQQVEAVEAVEAPEEIPVEDFLQGVMRDEEEIRRMMELCLNGGEMGQQEMLQMQALIYSYSQRVELTTKVVEKATSGVQQMMNTQV